MAIHIKRQTLRKARKLGMITLVGGLCLGSCYATMTSRGGRVIHSYVGSIFDSLGISPVAYANDDITSRFHKVMDDVEKLYHDNANRMAKGDYNQLMFIIYTRVNAIEDFFLEHAEPTAKREYLEKHKLDKAELQQGLDAYKAVAPQRNYENRVFELTNLLEGIVDSQLDTRTVQEVRVGRILSVLSSGVLNEEGRQKVLQSLYAAMPADEITTTSMSYVAQTPDARRRVLDYIISHSTPEERVAYTQSMIGSLPEEQYVPLVVDRISTISPTGYEMVESKMDEKKTQLRKEKVHGVVDRVVEYIFGDGNG